jgi:hypothetical protein
LKDDISISKSAEKLLILVDLWKWYCNYLHEESSLPEDLPNPALYEECQTKLLQFGAIWIDI